MSTRAGSGRRWWAPLLTGLFGLAIGGAGEARADLFVRGAAGSAAAVTDNVRAIPTTENYDQSAFFVVGQGRLALFNRTDRSAIGLAYGINAFRYYSELPLDDTVNHTVSGAAMWEITRDITFSMRGGFARGRLNTFLPYTPTPDTPPATSGVAPAATVATPLGQDGLSELRPTGPLDFYGVNAEQALRWRLEGSLEATESTVVTYFHPLAGPVERADAWSLQQNVGASQLVTNGLTGTFNARLVHTRSGELTDEEGEVVALGRSMTFQEALVGVRREFSPALEVEGALGLLGSVSVRQLRAVGGPALRAGVKWQGADLFAAALYEHTLMASLFVGRTLLVDSVTVSAGTALDVDRRWYASLGGRYQHGRRMSPSGRMAGSIDLLSGNASLRYTPRGPFRFALNVISLLQRDRATAAYDRPVRGFEQTTALFSVEAALPANWDR